MDTEAIISLYSWAPGTCFRHPERGTLDTAPIKTIHPRRGSPQEVRACRECVVGLEGDRRRTAEQAGHEYVPGQVGDGDE